MSSVLLDLGNLNGGGGVQVGASVLDELAKLQADPEAAGRFGWLKDHLVIEASPLVCRSASDAAVHELPVTVVSRGPRDIATWIPGREAFDVAFTLFGPAYGPRRGRRQIVGFADITSLHPKDATAQGTPPQGRSLRLARRTLSRWYFRRSDRLIVESPQVALDLAAKWRIAEDQITVVPNTFNAVFRGPKTEPFELPTDLPTFCYVTRAYPHKNLDLLAPALRELRRKHGYRAKVVLTLRDAEWRGLSPDLRIDAINLGPLPVEEVPAVYASVSGSVFPSRLEAFSVSPLEAMVSGCPLIASDRAFVRCVAGDAATYADPDDPSAWANAMAAVIRGDPPVKDRVSVGLKIAESWPTAADRVLEYVRVIDAELRA